MKEQDLKMVIRGREKRTLEYKEAWSELPSTLFETMNPSITDTYVSFGRTTITLVLYRLEGVLRRFKSVVTLATYGSNLSSNIS